MVSFFEQAHVSMWACDHEFRIVLWNEGAAKMYGRSAESVLGRRYDELFIDEAERDQSLADCLQIIREGTRFENFLALDHDARGNERQILTNCFRITDPATGVHYQAEIGVDIADLPVAQRNLRTLRELGLRQIIEREQTLNIRKTHLELTTTQVADAVALRAKERAEALDEALQRVGRRLKDENRVRYEARKQALLAERAAIESELRAVARRISACTGIDETIDIERQLGRPEDWLARIDRAAAPRR